MRVGNVVPTIHDAATAAVENRGSGGPVDASVARRVSDYLGADLSGVRVHSDPLSQEATAAMGARAFAYGGDVFLGPGARGDDLGLLAHELTHVVQQGAAGQCAPQRQVQVGAANSPAERQADAVSAAVAAGEPGAAAADALIVDNPPLQPGQMLKSQFLDQLHAQVMAAARDELGPVWSITGCPYIEQYFGRYDSQPASAGEALLKRFAPGAAQARTAADMIPPVVARVREGVRNWRDTGQPPSDIAAVDPRAAAGVTSTPPRAQEQQMQQGASVAAPSPPAAQAKLADPDSPAALVATLGPGEQLDPGTASRMEGAFGQSFAEVRIHTDATAARFADEHDAQAFTVGSHVAFGANAYRPGSPEGDALVAHELAHVVQQQAAGPAEAAIQRKPVDDGGAEEHADQAAYGVMGSLWGGAKGAARSIKNTLKTDIGLKRCSKTEKKAPSSTGAPATTGDTFTAVAPTVRAATDAPAREAALAVGITGATRRLAELRSLTSSSSGPIPALRTRITGETQVTLDANPYVTLGASHVEAAWRAWAENPASATDPWTLLAIWMKEGLSASQPENTLPANDAADARAIYRSKYYYQNMGADHYIHFTATTGDNAASFAPGTGAAHDTAFRAAIAAQLAAGRLPRDIGPEIDAQLTVTAAGGNFTVTQGARFQALSLMLVDAYWRENQAGTTGALTAHGMAAAGSDLDALTYMRWNMGSAGFNHMLGRNMSGNRDPDGSTPPLPTWALHREVKASEYGQPRSNAIRLQFYQQAYRYIFEGGY